MLLSLCPVEGSVEDLASLQLVHDAFHNIKYL
jgi:hypothetical protein